MIDKKTIFLIVEDFEMMRKVTAAQLRSFGADKILLANNGAEALRILRKQPVDIVLSDWNMPVMSGLELLREMRFDQRFVNIPFIMITAEADRERIKEAIAIGVTDLLVKPYSPDRLSARIERALTTKSRRVVPPLPHRVHEAAAPAAVKAPVDEPQLVHEVERPKILVVDDSADNLMLLAHLFKDDYVVRIAHKGDKALSICCSDSPPDMVLLDIMMPGMDGFDVARRIREHPNGENIPVIFVTAMTDEAARMRGLELGAVDFVSKPIDPEVLKLRVRNFMKYVEMRKHLQADYDSMLELARLREDVEHITRHDMKGPLAGIIGVVQTLADGATVSRVQQEQLAMVEETALQLLNMINMSSELFKIETGRFVLDAKPVPIGDMLRRIVAMSRVTFAEKRLKIVVDTDVPVGVAMPQVQGDAMLCYSIFQNLIKNACEAAPDFGIVQVVLHDADPLRIVIENRGAVPTAIRERFFDKFVTAGKQGGTGLGTYSAKLLVEAQHGRISLDVSDVRDITTITVELPRSEKRAAAMI